MLSCSLSIKVMRNISGFNTFNFHIFKFFLYRHGMNEFSRKCLNNSINRCQSSKCNIPLDILNVTVLWFQNVSNFAYPVPEPDWMVFVCPGWERWQQYWPSDIVCARCQWMTIYDIHDIFMVIHVMYHAKYKHHQRTLHLTNIKFLPPTTHAAF